MSDLGREFTLIAATRNLIKVVERGRHETQVPSRKFLKFLPQSGTLKIPAGFLGIISVTVPQSSRSYSQLACHPSQSLQTSPDRSSSSQWACLSDGRSSSNKRTPVGNQQRLSICPRGRGGTGSERIRFTTRCCFTSRRATRSLAATLHTPAGRRPAWGIPSIGPRRHGRSPLETCWCRIP